MEFFSQEHWNVLLFPPPGYLPEPGIEPASPASPALAGGFFPCKGLGATPSAISPNQGSKE